MAIGRTEGHDRNQLIDLINSEVAHFKQEKVGRNIYVYLDELPDLKECACQPPHIFDRTKNSRRHDIAKRIIQQTKRNFPDKTQLNYLSLGSGLLLQDFIICGLLLVNGYSLCVRLIDPICTREDFRQAYDQFCRLQLFAETMGLTFDSAYFSSVLEYIREKPEEQIDVGHAIDFDPYVDPDSLTGKIDLHYAYQTIAQQGFFYCAITSLDYLFTQSSYRVYSNIDLAQPSPAKAFIQTSKNMTVVETKIANAMGMERSNITKYILEYVGLFALRVPERLNLATEEVNQLRCGK